ncbi:hypothetical protein AXF42_Ash011230 [Apostasia shenzhenica]|uniref:Uncharacterized protein n=1 Tax=Apostasia shenzhenica TaxID=1088818 RepID=A0A2I0AL83_9ASPA|nr:hypothetical protein AXF42_Ash011230 [Apostasia shenzhenica]
MGSTCRGACHMSSGEISLSPKRQPHRGTTWGRGGRRRWSLKAVVGDVSRSQRLMPDAPTGADLTGANSAWGAGGQRRKRRGIACLIELAISSGDVSPWEGIPPGCALPKNLTLTSADLTCENFAWGSARPVGQRCSRGMDAVFTRTLRGVDADGSGC